MDKYPHLFDLLHFLLYIFNFLSEYDEHKEKAKPFPRQKRSDGSDEVDTHDRARVAEEQRRLSEIMALNERDNYRAIVGTKIRKEAAIEVVGYQHQELKRTNSVFAYRFFFFFGCCAGTQDAPEVVAAWRQLMEHRLTAFFRENGKVSIGDRDARRDINRNEYYVDMKLKMTWPNYKDSIAAYRLMPCTDTEVTQTPHDCFSFNSLMQATSLAVEHVFSLDTITARYKYIDQTKMPDSRQCPSSDGMLFLPSFPSSPPPVHRICRGSIYRQVIQELLPGAREGRLGHKDGKQTPGIHSPTARQGASMRWWGG